MKVYLGPYKEWIGPYQIASLLKYVGISENTHAKIGEWLSNNTPLRAVCEWIEDKRGRTIKVRIDNYDVWGADNTLAYIIVPTLKLLKEKKHGAPNTDDEDVPEELRSTAADLKENDWDIDSLWMKRWEWIMDEMIWAFEHILDEEQNWKKEFEDSKLEKVNTDREANGLRLFAKYYRCLWD